MKETDRELSLNIATYYFCSLYHLLSIIPGGLHQLGPGDGGHVPAGLRPECQEIFLKDI